MSGNEAEPRDGPCGDEDGLIVPGGAGGGGGPLERPPGPKIAGSFGRRPSGDGLRCRRRKPGGGKIGRRSAG